MEESKEALKGNRKSSHFESGGNALGHIAVVSRDGRLKWGTKSANSSLPSRPAMPEYNLYLLCAECGRFHCVPTGVSLEQSFEISLAHDVYKGEIPAEFHQ